MYGDLNFDLSKHNLDHATKKLESLFETYQLTQLIDEDTRITQHLQPLLIILLQMNQNNFQM